MLIILAAVALVNARTANATRQTALLHQIQLITLLSEQRAMAHDYVTAALLALEALPDQNSLDETRRGQPFWPGAEKRLNGALQAIKVQDALSGQALID